MRAERRANRTKKSKKWIIVVLGVLLIALVAIYMLQFTFFKTHYFPKSTANGISISEMTVDEAERALLAHSEKSTFDLIENGTPWKKIPKKDLGIQYDYKKGLQEIIKKQNNAIWFTSYFAKQKHDIKDSSLDQKNLDAYIETLGPELEKINVGRTQTENASIKKEGAGFQITPEVQGTTLDIAATKEGIKKAITTGKNSVELESFQQQATVKSDNAELVANLENINKIVNQTAQYRINGQVLPIPKENIADWIDYDAPNNKIALNQDKITAFVTSIGEQYNTNGKPASFKSTQRGEVSVPSGTYNWSINTPDEAATLSSELLALKGVDRSPIIQGSAPAGAPLIGDTYIEIDMQNQHMYFYKGGGLVLDTDIVTGKPTTPTPLGVYYVWNKARNQTLRGTNDDGSKYASPVSYWMPIDWTGVGIHDSDWQPAYGGSLWQSVGSHGCINTPPALAGQLFDSVEVGTPVVVF